MLLTVTHWILQSLFLITALNYRLTKTQAKTVAVHCTGSCVVWLILIKVEGSLPKMWWELVFDRPLIEQFVPRDLLFAYTMCATRNGPIQRITASALSLGIFNPVWKVKTAAQTEEWLNARKKWTWLAQNSHPIWIKGSPSWDSNI